MLTPRSESRGACGPIAGSITTTAITKVSIATTKRTRTPTPRMTANRPIQVHAHEAIGVRSRGPRQSLLISIGSSQKAMIHCTLTGLGVVVEALGLLLGLYSALTASNGAAPVSGPCAPLGALPSLRLGPQAAIPCAMPRPGMRFAKSRPSGCATTGHPAAVPLAKTPYTGDMEEEPAPESQPPHLPSTLVSGPEAYQDVQALRTLAAFTYIWSGVCALGACGGGGYALFGHFLGALDWRAGEPFNEGPAMGAAMVNGGFAVMVVMGALAILHFIASRALTRNRKRALILISAGLACLNIPFGTILGVFTFIVMTRPGVQAMFASSR